MSENPKHEESDINDSNPNAGGPEALAGDMGISSERTGADLPSDSVQGTGSAGTSTTKTNGTGSSATDGPAMDETQAQATGEWREEQPDANEGVEFSTGIDRTVGESNPAQVPSHPNHPEHNPGHSH